eukprot:4798321-Lingulodinium_polyedra.AAC.1
MRTRALRGKYPRCPAGPVDLARCPAALSGLAQRPAEPRAVPSSALSPPVSLPITKCSQEGKGGSDGGPLLLVA